MAKKDKQQTEPTEAREMTLAEARAFRASLHKEVPVELSTEGKREEFRKFWAQVKAKYGKSKDSSLESIIWLHIKASKLDAPEQFEAGLAHFGLKQV